MKHGGQSRSHTEMLEDDYCHEQKKNFKEEEDDEEEQDSQMQTQWVTFDYFD